jgi:hypothetical protein
MRPARFLAVIAISLIAASCSEGQPASKEIRGHLGRRDQKGIWAPGTAWATGSSGHARAPGAARSRFANPEHPCELRAAVVHRPMRA